MSGDKKRNIDVLFPFQIQAQDKVRLHALRAIRAIMLFRRLFWRVRVLFGTDLIRQKSSTEVLHTFD